MKLIVGLGNPENKYQFNRHNVGFILLDNFAKTLGLEFSMNTKMNSLIAQSSEIILCKPMTFMNNSGSAVSKLSNFYKIKPEDIYVIHDDLDLGFGILKKHFGRGSAGHHGVEDIMSKLKTKDFHRIRFGIGRPMSKEYTSKYVLNDFTQEELEYVKKIKVEDLIS